MLQELQHFHSCNASPLPENNMEPIWIDWAKRLQAIAQTGLTYAE
ncbi:MAG: hypothetical protein HGB05_13865, partial [Chloroflexi bacterium]|nr:hypothetical protein [Chloroflexota bacterium]